MMKMETKKNYYQNTEFTMYRIGDHLWISNATALGEHLVEEFSLQKMLWHQSFYTTDEVESIFNVNRTVLK